MLPEPQPLDFSLIKAKIAAGSAPPLIVRWEAEAGLLQHGDDVVSDDTVLLKRKPRRDVRLARHVPLTVFVGAETDVAHDPSRADVVFEGPELELPRTPSILG